MNRATERTQRTGMVVIQDVEMTVEAARNLEAVGSPTPDAIVKYDIETLRDGGWTRESLLAYCLDGAEDEHAQGWQDYVSAVCLAAGVQAAADAAEQITEDDVAQADAVIFATQAFIASLKDLSDTERQAAISMVLDAYCSNCGGLAGRACYCMRDD